jgi:hypothetical protein
VQKKVWEIPRDAADDCVEVMDVRRFSVHHIMMLVVMNVALVLLQSNSFCSEKV